MYFDGGWQLNKVIAFGDSFTYGHELSDCPTNDYYKHSNLTYAALVAQHLGYEYVCQAVGEYANNAISRRIIELLDSIDTKDLVLAMWTFPIRREFLLEGNMGRCSITPADKSNFALNYYRYLDTNSSYLITETLKEIYIAQTLLESKGIRYIFLTTDTGLCQALVEKNTSTHGNLISTINTNSWLLLENNLGFDDWARQGLKLNFRGHPPDVAHKELSYKIIEKINE